MSIPQYSDSTRQRDQYDTALRAPAPAKHRPGGTQPVPDALRRFQSQADAYYNASWDMHARFFQAGVPVQGNTNVRRFTFPNGSYLQMRAHFPIPRYTAELKAEAALYGVMTPAVAAIGALLLPPTAPALIAGGLAVGGVGQLIFWKKRAHDAIWQALVTTAPGRSASSQTHHANAAGVRGVPLLAVSEAY